MSPIVPINIGGVTDTEAIVLPSPLTVDSILARRAEAPKLVAGTAAWTSSDLFKTPVSKHSIHFQLLF